MLSSTAEADQVIESSHREFTPRLLVDWNNNGQFDHPLSDLTHYVESLETDRNLQGSAPDELTLIQGASAAVMKATIGGTYNYMPMISVFSVYSSRSPFYGKHTLGVDVDFKLEVETALGTVSYPQFKGFVRSIEPDRSTGEVDIEFMDRVEILRKPVDFARWAVVQRLVGNGRIRAQLCNSQWVIDHCLRLCDTSPTKYRPVYKPEMGVGPEAKDGVHFWLSGTGSLVPTRGHLDNVETMSVPDTEGGGIEMYSYGGAVADPSIVEENKLLCFTATPENNGDPQVDGAETKYWVHDRDTHEPEGTHYVGMTVITDNAVSPFQDVTWQSLLRVNIGAEREVRLVIHQSQVYLELYDLVTQSGWTGSFVSLPSNVPSAFIRGIFDYSQNTGCRLFLEVEHGGSTGWETIGADKDYHIDPYKGLISVNRYVKMQDIHYGFRNIYGEDGDFFNPAADAKYIAVLDSGNNRFTFIPESKSGSDAWDIIKEVANAEWGSVFWNEQGVFRFWNYDTMMSKQGTIVREFTLDDVTGLSIRNSIDSVRNVFSVDTHRKVSVAGKSYEARDEYEFVIPPATRKNFRIWQTDVMSLNPAILPRYSTVASNYPAWNDDIVNGFVVQYFVDGSWQERDNFTSGPEITAYFNHDRELIISVWNPYTSQWARLSNNNGDVALRLSGSKILDYDTQVVSRRYDDSIAKYDRRNLRLTSDWYQDEFQSTRMLDAMAERTTRPVPVTDAITIPGDPRLQLGDTIEIRDPEGFGDRLKAQILGINRKLDPESGLTDTLTVELLRPGGWVLGDPVYSVLGTSTVL